MAAFLKAELTKVAAEAEAKSILDSNSFDSSRFISCNAQSVASSFKSKGLVVDRGFNPSHFSANFKTWLKARGMLRLFTNPSNSFSRQLVREFYANFFEGHDIESVFVRGKYVNAGAAAINAFLGVSAQPRVLDELKEFSTLTGNELLAAFELVSNEPVVVDNKLKCTSINESAKQLLQWSLSNLLCTTHWTIISAYTLFPVIRILQDKDVDFGELIVADMRERVRTGRVSLGHGYLINELCKKAGVVVDRSELDVEPLSAILLPSTWVESLGVISSPPVTRRQSKAAIDGDRRGNHGCRKKPISIDIWYDDDEGLLSEKRLNKKARRDVTTTKYGKTGEGTDSPTDVRESTPASINVQCEELDAAFEQYSRDLDELKAKIEVMKANRGRIRFAQ
ncbi:uncharacterized protein LOC127266680 isoform X2 [Andrographis paniculata]|nr:uncharacterized protein LOC127266680 isoform X2 [Andrographis paniculata]